jgi:hypothetical protein
MMTLRRFAGKFESDPSCFKELTIGESSGVSGSRPECQVAQDRKVVIG